MAVRHRSSCSFVGPTPQRAGWTATGPSLAGRLHSLGFLLVGELAQVPHYPETRASPGGCLHRTRYFGIRSGRHAHAPGSSSASCCCNGSFGLNLHTCNMYYLIPGTWKCGSLSFVFTHPPEDLFMKRKKH